MPGPAHADPFVFTRAFHAARVAMAQYGRDRRLEGANRAFAVLFGLPSPDCAPPVLTLEEGAFPADAIERLSRGEPVEAVAQVDFDRLRARGFQTSRTGASWIQTAVDPLPPDRSGTPAGYLVQVFDVTPQHAALTAAAESRTRLEQFADSAPIVIARADARGAIVALNRKWEEFTGRPEAEGTGHGWLAFVHPDDQPALVERCGASVREGVAANAEYRMRRADGQYRWVLGAAAPIRSASGQLDGFVATALDVDELHQAKTQLALSQARLRLAIEASDAGYFEHASDFSWGQVERRWAEIFGYQRRELPDPSRMLPWLMARVHGDDRQGLVAQYAALVCGERDRFDRVFRVQHRDGGWRWVRMATQIVARTPAGHVDAVAGVLFDVTSDLERQERVRVLQASVEAAAHAVVITDAAGTIVWANPAFTTLTGYETHEVIGGTPRILRSGAHGQDFYRQLWSTITAGRVWHGEVVNRRRDGSEYTEEMSITPVTDASGAITHFVALKQDVTERRQVEQALRTSEASLAEAQRIARIGSWTWDVGQPGAVCSAQAMRNAGLEPGRDEPTPGAFASRVHPEDAARAADEARRCGETLQPTAFEYRVVWPDGRVRTLECRMEPVIGEDGTLIRVRGTTQDVTEKKEAEAALVQARNEALQASRAKGAFLAMMSHELRTPLNGLLGCTELLFDTNPTPEQREHLEIVQTTGRTLLGIIGDVLDWSKIEAGRLEIQPHPFALADLLARIVRTFEHEAAAKGIALAVHCPPDFPRQLIGDETRIGQVLFNLVGNAIKFTLHGRVDVTLRHGPAPGGPVRIEVEDTGIGIPLERQRLLFEPFTQADTTTTRRFGGTGLGLAISKRLVTTMQGTLSLESEPGHGSRFSVALPLAVPVGPGRTGTSGVGSGRQACPLRVLVAEDNGINRRVAQAMLRKLGYDAEFAHDGREVVERAAAAAYDLILMDLEMPERDGLDATRAIRAGSPSASAYVAAVTAHATAAHRDQCLAAGMDDFIVKPFKADDLAGVIARCRERRSPAA